MSTNSTIAKKNSDGSITAIYCHWDGYISHNGKILLEHYTDEAKIDELLALGSLSVLGESIGEKVDFDTFRNMKADPTQCLAYGRDRGEKNVSQKIFKTEGRYEAYAQQSYNYLFENGHWTVNRELLSSDVIKAAMGVLD